MCGRYTLFEDTEDQELNEVLRAVHAKYPAQPIKTGEIFPTNPAPVLLAGAKGIPEPERMFWGFPHFVNKGVIINARAETADEKPMFRRNLQTHRCVIPSTGFYEWRHDRQKTKYHFRLPGKEALYMAGIFQLFDGEARFVILTTAANESMEEIHNRMPVILARGEIGAWLFAKDRTAFFLHRIPEPLVKEEADARG